MICDDAASAKLVTFSKELGGVRSVTLDGDIYDPSGTLSGGSAPSSSGILVKVQELQTAEQRLRDATQNLQQLEANAAKNAQIRERWRQMSGELDLKRHEVALVQQQVEGSNASRVCLTAFLRIKKTDFCVRSKRMLSDWKKGFGN